MEKDNTEFEKKIKLIHNLWNEGNNRERFKFKDYIELYLLNEKNYILERQKHD